MVRRGRTEMKEPARVWRRWNKGSPREGAQFARRTLYPDIIRGVGWDVAKMCIGDASMIGPRLEGTHASCGKVPLAAGSKFPIVGQLLIVRLVGLPGDTRRQLAACGFKCPSK